MCASDPFLLRAAREPALSTGDRVWSGRDLLNRSADLRDRLVRVAEPREPIAVILGSTSDSVACFLAVDGLQNPVVLIPPSLPDGEMRNVLQSSDITLLVMPTDTTATGSQPRDLEGWCEVTAGETGTVYRHGDLEFQESDVAIPTDAVCQLTSGSLGASRLAVRSRKGIMLEVEAVAQRLLLEPGERVLCSSSPAHSYGLVAGLLAPLSAGAEVVLVTGAEALPNALERTAPDVIVGLAKGYEAVMREMQPEGLAHTRLALSAGARLPAGLYESFLRWSGVPIRQDYGTTEVGTIAIDADAQPSPETVGAPLPHLEVRLSESGEVRVKSAVIARYYLEGGRLVPCLDRDGWYGTRDVGAWDGSGRLRLLGRLRAPVRARGVSADPVAMERALGEMPGVCEATVVQDGVERVRAIVVAPGMQEDEVRVWTRVHLPFEPDVIELRTELPRSPAGKVLHKYL